MAQHLNLHDPAQRPKAPPLNARQSLWAAGATLAVTAVLGAGLQWLGAQTQDRARALQAELQRGRAAQPPLAANLAAATELGQLRALDAQQRRVKAALGQGPAPGAGYADLFGALARQAHPSLWITGFAVSADGTALELNGRMVDADVLPDYLRRLNQESQFKGRTFAALDLKAVDPRDESGLPPFTEFALRSQAGRTEAFK